MPDKKSEPSPVDDPNTSVTYDEDDKQMHLEQKPGEQPVTIAGGALGPDVDPED